MDNRPACYAPWITSYEYPNNQIVPCCEWDQTSTAVNHPSGPISLEDRFNHPVMQGIKNELMSGKLPTECNNCIVLEKASNKSLRTNFNNTVHLAEKNIDYKWNKDTFELLHLDYRESNLCNFSCKMCGSSLSSTHAKIDGKYGKTGVLYNMHKLEMYLEKLDSVCTINFAGGEPLLTDAMWTTLKEIKLRGLQNQIAVSIVTNGSLLHRNEDSLLELCEGFKYTDISVSIDCVNEKHNYWRQKGTWATVKENMKILNKWKHGKDNAEICVRTAIGWPNAYAARDVFDMFKDQDIQQRWNIISSPIGLDPTMMPQEDLDKLVEHWKDYPNVQYFFSNIKSNPNIKEMEDIKRGRFITHDKWHGNSFVDVFPETAHIYNSICD